MKEWMIKLFRRRGFEKLSLEHFRKGFGGTVKPEKIVHHEITKPVRSTAKSAGYDITRHGLLFFRIWQYLLADGADFSGKARVGGFGNNGLGR